MAFENGSTLNVVYDNKMIGNTIDPTEWNNNFKEIEDKDNANVNKINANFAKLTANTGSAEVGSPAIAGLGEAVDSNVYAQLLLATTAILDRYTKAQIDGYRTSDADKYIANVTLNTGKDLVITWGDGDSQIIALDLEKIPVTFGFDQTGTKLVITNQDGSKYEADITSLINMYTFNDSSTIDFTATGYTISATINAGSITDTMLSSALVTQLQGYVDSAQASMQSVISAKNLAIDARDTTLVAKTDAQTARDNAQTYANNASASATTATTKASEASTSASNASTSATNSDAFAVNAKSWAIGTTGTRTDEDTNNAKYYCEQAQAIVGADYATSAELTAEITARQNADANFINKDGSVQMAGVLKTVGGATMAKQIEIAPKISLCTDGSSLTFSVNAYFDGTNWRYLSDGKATIINTNAVDPNKPMQWHYAIAGAKDAIITWVENSPLTTSTGLPLTGGTLSGALSVEAVLHIIDSVVTGYVSQLWMANKNLYLRNIDDDNTKNCTDIILSDPNTVTKENIVTLSSTRFGSYQIYGTHNVTASTSAPGTLAEGCQHQVYA